MTADTIKNIIMFILLGVGLYFVMRAKVSFQQRQQKAPDNAWSAEEKKLRMIGYGILAVDVLIALFIRV